MHRLDTLAHTNRLAARHPLEKAAFALGMLLLSLLLPPVPGGVLILALVTAAAMGAARIPPAAYVKVLLVPAGFLLVGAAGVAVGVQAGANGWSIGLIPDGPQRAAELAVRSLAAVSCLQFLAMTTPMSDLLGLFRQVRHLALLVELMLLIYRFVFLFAEVLDRTRTAQAARLGYRTTSTTLRSLGMLGAALLARSLGQARQLETGLAARGYQGELKVLAPQRTLSRSVLAAVLALQVFVALLTLVWKGGWL